MINHIPRLLQSAAKNKPSFECLSWLQNSMQLYQPLEQINSTHGLGLSSVGKIKKNQTIALVPTTSCFTGLELLECDRNRTQLIEDTVEMICKKHYSQNVNQKHYLKNVLKILIQLFVQSKDSDMSMHKFAEYLNYQQVANPLFWDQKILKQTYSNNLQTQIFVTQKILHEIYEDLREQKIYGLYHFDFNRLFSVVRQKNLIFRPENPKEYDQHYVGILCPLIDQVQHSFQPNCYIDGIYNQQSYVVLKSKETIQEGEELTINWGNFSNHDFLMRFGYVHEKNPFNELLIELDFDDYLEYSQDQFQLKQRIIKTNTNKDISLEQIKLYQIKINEDLLTLLRVYFVSDNDIKENPDINSFMWKNFKNQVTKNNEKLVCTFMIDVLEQKLEEYQKKKREKLDFSFVKKNGHEIINLENLDEINYIKDKNFRNLMQVQIEEELILQNNKNFFEKKLLSLS